MAILARVFLINSFSIHPRTFLIFSIHITIKRKYVYLKSKLRERGREGGRKDCMVVKRCAHKHPKFSFLMVMK